jgi:cysteine synthase A
VKDRIARHMIAEAERRGELKPSYTIVEATSGNTGVAKALRKRSPGLRIYAVDPIGKNSEGKVEPLTCSKHKVEGIGDGFIPSITDVKAIDEVIQVSDDDAIATAKRLAREKGLFVDTSSGAYVWASIRVAKRLGKGKTILTLLPDSADRYYSTDLFRE